MAIFHGALRAVLERSEKTHAEPRSRWGWIWRPSRPTWRKSRQTSLATPDFQNPTGTSMPLASRAQNYSSWRGGLDAEPGVSTPTSSQASNVWPFGMDEMLKMLDREGGAPFAHRREHIATA